MEQNNHISFQQQIYENKKIMIQILKQAPIAGVYKNQQPQKWNNFFNFYITFLKSQAGPRGNCAKKIRKQLRQKQNQVNKVLKILNMSAQNHIRDIYVKYKNYIPSQQYAQKLKLEENLKKFIQTQIKLQDSQSVICKNMEKGIKEKYGEQYQQFYQNQIKLVKNHYQQKIQQNQKLIKQKQQNLNKIKQYHQYIYLKNYMNQYFQEWLQADQIIGKENVDRGKNFQDKVYQQALPRIIELSKKQFKGKLEIFKNCKWNPKNLGEIDIALGEYDDQQQKYIIKVLIQCKSRLFDIRQAYKQVNSQEIKKNNKKILSTSKGQIQVDQNSQYFIITTLPEHKFLFPVESKMKQTLDRSTKNVPIVQIQEKTLFKLASDKFQNELSPLQWFLTNDSQRIIVLK